MRVCVVSARTAHRAFLLAFLSFHRPPLPPIVLPAALPQAPHARTMPMMPRSWYQASSRAMAFCSEPRLSVRPGMPCSRRSGSSRQAAGGRYQYSSRRQQQQPVVQSIKRVQVLCQAHTRRGVRKGWY